MRETKPRLKKREILLALVFGGLAAGGAAALISDMGDTTPEVPAQIVRDGPTQIEYDFTGFDEISTVGPQDLIITQGDSFSIRSQGSSRALEQIEVIVENERLLVRPKEGAFRGDWGSLEEATFYVTLPQLQRVAMAGSGDIRINGITGESFEGVIGGMGGMEVTGLQVSQAQFGIFGSGDLSVSGTAQDADITIGGSGEVKGSELFSQTASISIGGSGEVELSVEDEAVVSITGSGDVDIFGTATCSVTRMGGGNVSCQGGGGD